MQIDTRCEYTHLSYTSGGTYPNPQLLCSFGTRFAHPQVRVAAFNSSSVSTVRAEKLHHFLNNLIQIQLLQLFGGKLSKSSQSGTSITCEMCVQYKH